MKTPAPRTKKSRFLRAALRLVGQLSGEEVEELARATESRLLATLFPADESPPSALEERLCQEYRTCGKARCKCQRGEQHGPYWVGRYQVAGLWCKRYYGRKDPRSLDGE